MIREIFNPATRQHIDHVDDDPGPPQFVDAVDAHDGIRPQNIDWSPNEGHA
jgi:hypothetical protein